jgi:hypothetical protein
MHDERRMTFGCWPTDFNFSFRILIEIENTIVAKYAGKIFDMSQ